MACWMVKPAVLGLVLVMFGQRNVEGQQESSIALPKSIPETSVPATVRYTGVIAGHSEDRVAVLFSLYPTATGGSALWSESQSVTFDKDGKYAVMLGAGSTSGLPQSLFVAGEPRWLGVEVAGGAEQRSLLASVPYAMKAGDADSLEGRTASDFVTTEQWNAQVAAELAGQALTLKAIQAQPMTTTPAPTGSGTAGYLPIWTAATTLGNSVLYQTGSGSTAHVGFGTTAPTTKVDVNGLATIRSGLLMQSGAAAASSAVNSPYVDLIGSSYNSSTKAAVPQRFRWQVIVSGNNTSAPSGSLALGYGTTSASGTGLSISPKGIITFAKGQTFPGTSGGTTGTTIKAGSGLTASTSGTTETLGLDTTKVPLLAAANTFTSVETFNSSVAIGGASDAVARLVVTGAATSNGTAIIGSGGTGEGAYGLVGYGSQGTSSYVDGGSGAYFGGGAASNYGGSGVYMQGGTGKYPGSGAVLYGANDSAATYGGDGGDLFGGSSNTAYGGAGAQIFGGGSQSGAGGMGAFIEGGSSNSSAGGDGIEAVAGQGTAGSVYAGYFAGDVKVTGTLSAGAKNFQIDHPLDPANKYLNHTSIESSEMVNIYSGNITTDDLGVATVQLPNWFEIVNGDFRYQLTVLGKFAQAIVSQKIENHQFKISTNVSNVEVSWQVTGVRHDGYAKAHPLVVEQAKPASERGFYMHPELYGQPSNKQTEWGRHPEMMQARAARQTAPVVGSGKHIKKPAL